MSDKDPRQTESAARVGGYTPSPVIADRDFGTDPRSSHTLPARYYYDDAIYRAEKEAIFYRSWWYAGHVSQLTEAGAFLTTKIHEQNVFVVRGKDGELKAFYNVCQHRGHELLQGTGKVRAIICPYHAWTYSLDGDLVGARNTGDMPDFNRCNFSLKPVQIENFCGMIFINLDPLAAPLKQQSGELEKEIRHYCPDIDKLAFAARDEYHVQSNWKTLVDNFLECYHCQAAHKDFVDLVDMSSYRSSVHGIYSSHVSDAVRTTDSSAFSFEKGDVDFGYAGWFLWPNLTIWIYPGEPNLSVLQMLPNGSERAIEYQDWFVVDGKPSRQLREAMVYQKDILQPEDIGLCESVQRGLRSRGYNQGRFVTDNELSSDSEHAVHHFQSMVSQALGNDRFVQD